MLTFLRYSANLVFQPCWTMRSLMAHPHRVTFGFMGLLVLSAVYVMATSVALAKGIAPSEETLVLRIPPEQYYAYERVFILPVAIGSTILATGVIRLVARLWSGRGRFEDLFALLGFNLVIVAVAMGIPDLVISLSAPSYPEFAPHVWLVTLWYLFLMVVSVREAEGLSWIRSVVIALAGFVASAAVQFVFIR